MVFDLPFLNGVIEIHRLDRGLIKITFDFVSNLGRGAATFIRLNFDAVKFGRVMAGGDHDPGNTLGAQDAIT